MAKQVKCINKLPRQNPHERIQNIGGIEGGVRWKRTQQQAIADIEADSQSYFCTDQRGNSVWIVVATHSGNKYIKTQNDDSSQNNLLSLPECP
jgi:hypothetical protein